MLAGWSLVLPAGWAPPFWLAAAFAGCKPAGQREWRWLYTLQGQRSFPWDHPDTSAYTATMQQRSLQRQLAAAGRPKGKQMLAAPPCPPAWGELVCGAGGGQPQSEPAAAAMEVDGDSAAAAAAAAGEAAAPALGPQLFVARSHAAMAEALQGTGSSSGISLAAAAPPRGLREWRPAQGAAASRPGGGLLEVLVQPIKTGVAAEGAALCFLEGKEAVRHRTPVTLLTLRQQRRRHRELEEEQAALAEAGGDPQQAVQAAARAAACGRAEAAEQDVRVIGYVLSEAPRGAPRRCRALAAAAAAPTWRLRSLQHGGGCRDGGIEAFVRNPGSATLFPVRLHLCVEQPAAAH